MVYKCFDKKTSDTSAYKLPGGAIKSMWNERPLDLAMQQLPDEIHKPIIKTFKRRKVYSSFKDNIWGVDLADIQLRRFNRGIRFLLYVIDLFSKYALVIPLKDEKGTTIVDVFQAILDDSKRKPNKTWVDQGSEFYYRSESRRNVFNVLNVEMYFIVWREICLLEL